MQLALELFDSFGADEEWAALDAGFQGAERDGVCDAVDGEVMRALEASDRVGGDRSVAPVDASGLEAERCELVLEFFDAIFAS